MDYGVVYFTIEHTIIMIQGIFAIILAVPHIKKLFKNKNKEKINQFHITGNKNTVTNIVGSKLTININNLSDKTSKRLLNYLNESKNGIVPKERVKEIENISKKLHQTKYPNLKVHIPPRDFRALQAAEFINRNNAGEMKADIRERFGDRGNKIANLCSAGYFLSLEELCKALCPKNKELFRTMYERAIISEAFAVFITRGLNKRKTKNKIENKIKSNKLSGVKHIDIHAIGSDNIKKANKIIEQLIPIYNLKESSKPKPFRKANSISVRYEIKK